MIESPDLTQELARTQLDAGGFETIESEVYGDTEAFDGNCPETGTYQFNRFYTLELRRNPGSAGNQWERRDNIDWGFSLRVE